MHAAWTMGQVTEVGWNDEAIQYYLFGLKAKAICIAEHAMRLEEDFLKSDNQEQDKPKENARFLNLRKLVWEFNRLHRRFVQVVFVHHLFKMLFSRNHLCVQQIPYWDRMFDHRKLSEDAHGPALSLN
jgi:hypothetical protein